MNYNDSIKKILVGLIILVAVAAVIAIAASLFINPASDTTEQVQEVPQEITKTDVEAGKDPAKFPAGIPIEANAKITQNYNATAKDGRFQATKVFETNRTLTQNFTTYQDYMRANGWEVKSTVNNENYKMIYGTKGNANLQVSIDNNLSLDVKTVNISYTEVVTPAVQ